MAESAADGARLSTLLEYPELSRPLPDGARLPDDFERSFPETGIARIRRGPLSATLILGGSSRLLTMRYGAATIEGIRFATSFFGKGQFIPDDAGKQDGAYRFRQVLEAPYYQPLPKKITTQTWSTTRDERRHSEVARLEQSAEIVETAQGFNLRVRSTGTTGVPLAVEIASLPDEIRGYGHVKDKSVHVAEQRLASLMARWQTPSPRTPAMAAE